MSSRLLAGSTVTPYFIALLILFLLTLVNSRKTASEPSERSSMTTPSYVLWRKRASTNPAISEHRKRSTSFADFDSWRRPAIRLFIARDRSVARKGNLRAERQSRLNSIGIMNPGHDSRDVLADDAEYSERLFAAEHGLAKVLGGGVMRREVRIGQAGSP